MDGSLYSRDTEDEKSFESNEDNIFMTDRNVVGNANKKNSKDNDQSDNDNKSSAARSRRIADARKNSENAEDDDDNDNDKTDDENDKGNTSDNTIYSKKENDKKRKKLPLRKNLNDDTLIAIQNYLKSGDFYNNTLEYEEVAYFSSKIHRYTIERTRGRQGLLFQDGTIQNGDDLQGDIEPIVITEEDAAEELVYNQVYQKEEFHAVAMEFSKAVMDGALQMAKPTFVWHNKTANWLKRAAGMQRQYDPYETGENQQSRHLGSTYSEDSDDGEGETANGNSNGGGDIATKRVTRRRVKLTRYKRRQERFQKENENFRIISEVALELSKQPRNTDDCSDVYMTNPIATEINGESLYRFPTLEQTGLKRICMQNDITLENESGNESKESACESAVLPPVVARCGLEFRRRALNLEEVRRKHRKSRKGRGGGAGRGAQATNRLYAKKCKALMTVLSNKLARSWTIHEFFYNDLDREWYQIDGFIADLVRLGLPINSNTKLTKQEWSLIRRTIRPRPRLFSKRFIAEQLKKRNHHRALVRRLQQDPEVTEFSPISTGTHVTAYHIRGSTIGTGRVLLHDPKTHNYLIQFADRKLGCEVCPDSDVRVSLPTKATTAKAFSPQLYEPCRAFSADFSSEGDNTELVLPKDITGTQRDDEIDRELLNSVLAVTMEAFERKRAILQALERCATDEDNDTSKHATWLLANLDQINRTLKAASMHLQVLYGSLYGSPVSGTETPEIKREKMALRTELPKTNEFREFMASLASATDKIGEFAFSFLGDGNGDSSNKRLQSDFLDSAKLLLIANYLAETSSTLLASGIEKTIYSGMLNPALKSLLDNFVNNCLPSTSETLLVGKRLKEESGIEFELKQLGLAVGMLRAEVAIAADESRAFELNNAMA
ncbi:unnamed protein product [Pseudo-nitzschia multistriata]|uniref:DIRP domain-containing protein n=1 Tax=Pseudo-nitzschia multistriata TaxID=183589 RepID=A0A448ZJU1_9STRA|nr:unnamed protein product [Pseudo-nitzschia multistriata]